MNVTSIFTVNELNRTRFQIILWWEIRRIFYNIMSILAVILSFQFLSVEILNIEMGTGEYFFLIGYVILMFVFNVIFTFGWLIEIFFRTPSLVYGPRFLIIITCTTFICIVLSGFTIRYLLT